jgi:DNA ligase-1
VGATLLEFARVNDAAAATTKKLQKYAILAEYLRKLEDDDLRLAVRFAAGRPFAATDERVLNVGWALVSDVVPGILKLDPREYHDLVVRSGEIGEALSKAWPPQEAREWPLQLADLARAFDDLAATGSWDAKREILDELFRRCGDGREAAYLAKIIFGDMRTGVQEGVLHYAIAQAFGRDGKLVQRCQLLVGDLGEVAVLAKHDACGTAAFRLFHPVQFMLATPQETADDAAATMEGRVFSSEDKLDGIRAQVHKAGEGAAARVALYTRTMDRTDASFPDVVESLSKLPGEFLLDGEIVPWRDGCVLPFAHIQKRLGRKVLTAKILRENPAAFVAFDLLYQDGDLLMDRPLKERRERLQRLSTGTVAATCGPPADVSGGAETVKESEDLDVAASALPAPAVSPSSSPSAAVPLLLTTQVTEVVTAEQIAAAFDSARGRRNEGIVLKDPASPYSPGRRGQMWLKIKTHLPTFDCVVTAAETGHGKRRNWLSDYTFAVWDRDPADPEASLVNVGKAYSGLTEEEIIRLTELFTRGTVQQYGRVRLVQPQVVLEIACDQIQSSNRHASGYALRFPRIKRIRTDKRPEDADRLSRIVEIYESSPNFARPVELPKKEAPEPTLFD